MTFLYIICHPCMSHAMFVCHMSLLFVILHPCNISWTRIIHEQSSSVQIMLLLCVCTFVVNVQQISFQFVDQVQVYKILLRKSYNNESE